MAVAAIKPSHRGLLHHKMGVPEGHRIPLGKLMAEKSKAKRTGDSALMKEANFALVARKWHHG